MTTTFRLGNWEAIGSLVFYRRFAHNENLDLAETLHLLQRIEATTQLPRLGKRRCVIVRGENVAAFFSAARRYISRDDDYRVHSFPYNDGYTQILYPFCTLQHRAPSK